jgi:hypothetical protein
VLWGSRATHFDAESVHSVGQESPVAIFVGGLIVHVALAIVGP